MSVADIAPHVARFPHLLWASQAHAQADPTSARAAADRQSSAARWPARVLMWPTVVAAGMLSKGGLVWILW